MTISGSSKISVLDFGVVFDISQATPRIIVTNRSSGPDLTTCKWWFVVSTPSASIVHEGSFGTPDKTGVWTTWTMPETWPQRFYHVEWSGAPYTITLYVNDGGSPAQLFSMPLTCELCPPPGNTGNSHNNFGVGKISYPLVSCTEATVTAKDETYYLYKSLTGTTVSIDWRLVYPSIPSGESLPDALFSGTSYVSFPLSYNGKAYALYLDVVRDYAIDANNTVRIKFKTFVSFDVTCNIDLCSIICGYQKLLDEVSREGCNDAGLKNKLTLVNAKVNLALVAVSSRCTGVNLSDMLNSIRKDLDGYDCGCGDNDKGISAQGLT